jgi:hypothetical protein
VLPFFGYFIFRHDWNQRKGDGICIHVRDGLQIKELRTASYHSVVLQRNMNFFGLALTITISRIFLVFCIILRGHYNIELLNLLVDFRVI